jgi:polysaccharide export outer membrane protein
MRNPLVYTLLICLSIWLSSCVTAKKQLYFQDLKGTIDSTSSNANDTLINSVIIQPHDLLDIRIEPMDEALKSLTKNQSPGGVVIGGNSISNFLVDANGNVNLPEIGELSLKGLTIKQARTKITSIFKRVYKSDPFVEIKFLTFRVTVLGEVAHPGPTIVANEKANLIDVLAQSGDLTDLANRQTIKIIRGDPRKPTVYIMDLTNTKTFKSAGFILQPNDVVYVEPFAKKFLFANLAQIMPFLVIVNTIGLIFSFLK